MDVSLILQLSAADLKEGVNADGATDRKNVAFVSAINVSGGGSQLASRSLSPLRKVKRN